MLNGGFTFQEQRCKKKNSPKPKILLTSDKNSKGGYFPNLFTELYDLHKDITVFLFFVFKREFGNCETPGFEETIHKYI